MKIKAKCIGCAKCKNREWTWRDWGKHGEKSIIEAIKRQRNLNGDKCFKSYEEIC